MRLTMRAALSMAAMCLVSVAESGAQSVVGLDATIAARARVATGTTIDTGSHDSVPTTMRETGGVRADSPTIGPTVTGAAVGVRTSVPEHSSRAVLPGVQEPRVGQSKALMIVGGAALVAGLIIGDDAGALLAVSGAVVGLYGLYLYVR